MLAIGCSSDDGKTDPPTDAMKDAPAGAMCTGAVYDPCTDNTQCTSGNCRLFSNDMIQVCTQSCGAGNPCPMAGATAVSCNMMGVCKPPTANNCTR